MPLRVQRLPRARQDRVDIWLHIAVDSQKAADRLTDRLDEVMEHLADFPEAGALRPTLGNDIRVFPVNNFLVVYRVTPDAVEIVRILHAARDISTDLLSD